MTPTPDEAPDRCPNCGGAAVALPNIVSCTDPWHATPVAALARAQEDWQREADDHIRTALERDDLRAINEGHEAAVADLRAAVARAERQRDELRRHITEEGTSIHADLQAVNELLGLHYDGASSPAGWLHGDIMPAVAALLAERDRWYASFTESERLRAAAIARAEAAERRIREPFYPCAEDHWPKGEGPGDHGPAYWCNACYQTRVMEANEATVKLEQAEQALREIAEQPTEQEVNDLHLGRTLYLVPNIEAVAIASRALSENPTPEER